MMMTVTADVPGRGHFESVPSLRGYHWHLLRVHRDRLAGAVSVPLTRQVQLPPRRRHCRREQDYDSDAGAAGLETASNSLALQPSYSLTKYQLRIRRFNHDRLYSVVVEDTARATELSQACRGAVK
jgi:hypothetical protein